MQHKTKALKLLLSQIIFEKSEIKNRHIYDITNCYLFFYDINMSKVYYNMYLYMYFSPRKLEDFGLIKLFSGHSLELAGVSIKPIRCTKFLGVIIDEELSWLPQIKKLSQKLNCQIGVLNRIKNNIPLKFHRDLYFTLFESHLSYCISVWGGVALYKLEPLLIAQKSCIRTLFGQHSFSKKCMTCARCRPLGRQTLDSLFYQKEHTKPLFKAYEMLAIRNLYAYHSFIEIFKILKFRQPIHYLNPLSYPGQLQDPLVMAVHM